MGLIYFMLLNLFWVYRFYSYLSEKLIHWQCVVLAITRRKIENTDEEIVRAINRCLLHF